MTGATTAPARRAPSCSAAEAQLTLVELTWIEKRIEHWIRFGQEVHEQILDRRRRVVGFAPDTIFAFVRWAANDFGTVLSHLDILCAARAGAPFQTLPSVTPGGDILLSVGNWPKVEQVLRLIDAIETLGIDPADAAPDHWRHVHNRLTAGLAPRPYTAMRHAAWLQRRKVGP